MRSGRKTLVVAVGMVFTLGVLVVALAQREPQYHGKVLSQWVADLHNPPGWSGCDPELAAKAVREIGTNAVPLFVRWAACAAPRWKMNFLLAELRIPPFVRQLAFMERLDGTRERRLNQWGIEGLWLLGDRGRGAAVPELKRYLASSDPDVKVVVTNALLLIAPGVMDRDWEERMNRVNGRRD